MTGGTDRASTVRALVRGESAVAFETALQDAKTAEDGQISPISVQPSLECSHRNSFSAPSIGNSATLDKQEDV
jgi:hypothetical protein